MAGESPIKGMSGGLLSVLVMVAGKEVPKTNFVLSVEVVKQINRVPYARIELHDGDAKTQTFEASEDASFAPGKEIELKVGYGPGKETSIFKGVIVEQGIRVSQYKSQGTSLILKCKDKAASMAVGRKTRFFFKKKDSDIISEVVKETSGLKATTDATTTTHEKLVQYNCSDWDFVIARADANGLVTIVEDGALTCKAPEISKKTGVMISFGKDLIDMNLRMDSTYQYKEIAAAHWDDSKQKLEAIKSKAPKANKQGNLDSKKLTKVLNPTGMVQTAGPVLKTFIQSWADAVHQRGALSRIRGTVRFYGSAKVMVGQTLNLFGLSKGFEGDGYISKVKHIIRDRQWYTEVELGLPPRMYLEENRDAMALPGGGATPPIFGLHQAVVKQIDKDPDGAARILVNVPLIDEAKGDGFWARMVHYYATAKGGFFFMPEVGDEVLLGFLNNDPSFPVILGSMYSKKIKPLYTADKDNTTKAIVTNSDMKVEFNDKDKIITILTPGKNSIIISDKDKSITIEDGGNKNTITMDSNGIKLDSGKDIVLNAKGKVMITATQDLKAKGLNVDLSSQANFKAKAGAQFKLEGTAGVDIKSSAMAKLEGAAMTMIKGGMVKIN